MNNSNTSSVSAKGFLIGAICVVHGTARIVGRPLLVAAMAIGLSVSAGASANEFTDGGIGLSDSREMMSMVSTVEREINRFHADREQSPAGHLGADELSVMVDAAEKAIMGFYEEHGLLGGDENTNAPGLTVATASDAQFKLDPRLTQTSSLAAPFAESDDAKERFRQRVCSTDLSI